MKIHVSPAAFDWFKEEFSLSGGDYIRLFARYGGFGQFQQGFSLGFSSEPPKNPAVTETIENITFFIEHEDLWYFDNRSVTLDIDPELDEIVCIHSND